MGRFPGSTAMYAAVVVLELRSLCYISFQSLTLDSLKTQHCFHNRFIGIIISDDILNNYYELVIIPSITKKSVRKWTICRGSVKFRRTKLKFVQQMLHLHFCQCLLPWQHRLESSSYTLCKQHVFIWSSRRLIFLLFELP